jgi:hypothetical protein
MVTRAATRLVVRRRLPRWRARKLQALAALVMQLPSDAGMESDS